MVRVLLVEDSAGDAALARHALERFEGKFTVAEASSVREATRALAGGFDIILLDLMLRDSGGVGTVKRVRAAAGGVPIAVLTGMDDDALGRACLEAGAIGYFRKGQLDPAELMRILEQHAAGSSPPQGV